MLSTSTTATLFIDFNAMLEDLTINIYDKYNVHISFANIITSLGITQKVEHNCDYLAILFY